jgi:hypothetical protein
MACVTELRYATEMPLCATAATATRHSWARTTPLPSAQIPLPVRRAFNYTQEFNLTRFPSTVARDQEVDVPTQLGLGVRLLQAQVHLNNGVIHFCHTSEHPANSSAFIYCSLPTTTGCALFDGGTVLAYLTTVKTWLDANPNEVLTLLFTNPEGLSIPGVWAPAFEQSG